MENHELWIKQYLNNRSNSCPSEQSSHPKTTCTALGRHWARGPKLRTLLVCSASCLMSSLRSTGTQMVPPSPWKHKHTEENTHHHIAPDVPPSRNEHSSHFVQCISYSYWAYSYTQHILKLGLMIYSFITCLQLDIL